MLKTIHYLFILFFILLFTSSGFAQLNTNVYMVQASAHVIVVEGNKKSDIQSISMGETLKLKGGSCSFASKELNGNAFAFKVECSFNNPKRSHTVGIMCNDDNKTSFSVAIFNSKNISYEVMMTCFVVEGSGS